MNNKQIRQRSSDKTRSPYHHGDHRGLLAADVVPFNTLSVEAILVPTARKPAMVRRAIALAAELGSTLVTFCSKWSSARSVAQLATGTGVELIAIDVTQLPSGLMPRFTTTETLVGTPLERKTDTSLKRNLGLLLARLIGWQRIVFLDDDIEVPSPHDLNDAVRLLDSYAAVGLSIDGFPDNSVVCHAYREAGGFQETFVGGGALAVGPGSMGSFFPNIYNEDWFFLLNESQLRKTAVTGRVTQRPYDPFANDVRARSEEFGDCLAEGIFWLLDQGRRVRDADAKYWRFFLDNRMRFINEVIAMADRADLDVADKRRMISALKAARGRCQVIQPDLCVQYLRAWRADGNRWRRHVDELHRQYVVEANLPRWREKPHLLDPQKLLTELGLMAHATCFRSTRVDQVGA